MSKKGSGFDPSRRGFLQGAAAAPIAIGVAPSVVASSVTAFELGKKLFEAAHPDWSPNDFIMALRSVIVRSKAAPILEQKNFATLGTQLDKLMLDTACCHRDVESLEHLIEIYQGSNLPLLSFMEEASTHPSRLFGEKYSAHALFEEAKTSTQHTLEGFLRERLSAAQSSFESHKAALTSLSEDQWNRAAYSGHLEYGARMLKSKIPELVKRSEHRSNDMRRLCTDASEELGRMIYGLKSRLSNEDQTRLRDDAGEQIFQAIIRGESPKTINARVALLADAFSLLPENMPLKIEAAYFTQPIETLDEMKRTLLKSYAAQTPFAPQSPIAQQVALYQAREHLNQKFNVEPLSSSGDSRRYRLQPKTRIPIDVLRKKLNWISESSPTGFTRLQSEPANPNEQPGVIVQTTDATTIALLEGMANSRA